MQFAGAFHVHEGAEPGRAAERVLEFSRACGWGEGLGIGSPALPVGRWTRLNVLRRRYREATADLPEGLPVVYHQLAGLDLFATEDTGRQRIWWIHEPFVQWSKVMGWAARYADGFVFDDPAWQDEMLERVNWIPGRRRLVLSAASLARQESAQAKLGGLLKAPVVRRFRSPSGRFNIWGLYRRQVAWLA